MILLRKTRPEELDEVMRILAGARDFMHSRRIPQWDNGYPSRELISADMHRGDSYVLEEPGALLGVCTVTLLPDPSYAALTEGAWLCADEPYAALHRVAVNPACRGRGIGREIFSHAEALARELGVTSLRGDTHPQNKLMRRLFDASGFTLCGVIELVNTEESDTRRIAFQKVLI